MIPHKLFHEQTPRTDDMSVLENTVIHLRAMEEHLGSSMGTMLAYDRQHTATYANLDWLRPILHAILMSAQQLLIEEKYSEW